MSIHTLPPARPYHPTTFEERGVALPFTTPLPGGARARMSRNRKLELIVRNPAGGQGVYVMPWTGIAALCRPTLYDKVVSSRIAFLESITPATVRNIGRAAAAEGLAGEAAMQAARAAAKTDEAERQIVVNDLLSSLVRQVNLHGKASAALPEVDPSDLDTRARQTVAWLAPRLGKSAGWGMQALEALADNLAGVGAGCSGAVGRIPRLVTSLNGMREEIADWAKTQRDGERVSFAHTVYSITDLTVALADRMIAQARQLTNDMVGLLRYWASEPEAVIRVATRPEWLLDGWDQVCLIWNYARDNAARRVALVEIADYIPPIPRELSEWGSGKAHMDTVFAEQGRIILNEDWRTGANVFDLIARNEQMRAAAP